MFDDHLNQQPNWRYCRVRAGEKKPYPANWQNMPLTLEQVDSDNIGLMLGPVGNGICAIDFDGTTAWAWLESKGVDYRTLPQTPTWTSGKKDRCQMAFWVPEEIWPYLKTIKITNSKDPVIAQGEGFEFRWAGGQSVLPPSIHPETRAAYQWIIEPNIICADLPLTLLELWVKECDRPLKDANFSPEIKIEDLDEKTIQDLDRALKHLKERHLTLAYDDWRTVAWASAHHVGRGPAYIMLQQYYPEQRRGEYSDLFKTWNKSKSPTIGSIMEMAGLSKRSRREQHKQEYMQYEHNLSELELIRKEIEKRKNNVNRNID